MTEQMVLIIAEAADTHALTVGSRLESEYGCDCFIWDCSRYPAKDKIVYEITSNNQIKVSLESKAIGRIELSAFRSIWWRRPLPPRILEEAGPDFFRDYCRRESVSLLRGALSAIDIPIYNHPIFEQRAEKKAYQLACAVSAGMSVPETLITNSADDVRRFFLRLKGKVIFKPSGAPPLTFYGTQRLNEDSLAGLSLLERAPLIFQQEIPTGKDIRVVVVGNSIFAAESCSKELDWRLDSNVLWIKHELPDHIKHQIKKVMAKMSLVLGSFDFRFVDDKYFFFEINPNGQFLFLEVDDKRLKITSKVAELLYYSAVN